MVFPTSFDGLQILGGYSQNVLSQICKIFVTSRLKILILWGLKEIFKVISLGIEKLLKFYEFALRGLVNFDPVILIMNTNSKKTF